MGRIRRSFSYDFKMKVVTSVTSGKLTVSEAARKNQISSGLVCHWLKKFATPAAEAGTRQSAPPQSGREKELERENAQLKEKVAELFLQVDLLKKAEISKPSKKNVSSSVITASNWAQYKKAAK
jgi:transposase